ncbi:MAG: SpoVR family protein [Myxococcales bacterium]
MNENKSTALPPHLADIRKEVEGYAREFGLDFYETIFEVVGFDELNMVAAYGGFPNRYPHWRFGMDYEQLSKGYEYGLSKIYELVINNNPSYAYLMESNMDVDQKLVMAHVFGHVDFFKHNFSFRHTNRKMMDEMANHATRIRRIIDRVGIEPVETFIDRALSLENLIDQHAPHFAKAQRRDPDAPEQRIEVHGFKTDREYMNQFINPQEFLDGQRKKLEDERARSRKFPERPQRDVLLFLLEHAPLERWEADILAVMRDEAYYFAPQGQTKVINEGWASYWHSTIMTQRALKDSEIIDYADHHSGTMGTRPGAINPYKLGIELWRHIEDRWNRGRFGKEYDDCDDLRARRAWDKKLGLGRQKIFEVRKHYNDITFIDEFLTADFAAEQKLFVYGFNEKGNRWEILDREFQKVKKKLLQQLTNFGQPIIDVTDGNFENRGKLLLAHRHDGVDLRVDYAKDTLANLQALWRRPVALVTRVDGKGMLMRFDGRDHTDRKVEY